MITAIKTISFPISPYKALCTIVRIKFLRHGFKTDSTVTLVGPKMWQPLVFQRWWLLFCCFAKSKLQRLPNFLYQAPRESLLKVMLSNIFLRALFLVQCLWWSPKQMINISRQSELARWQLVIICFYVQNHSHFPSSSSRCGYLIPDMGLKDESVKRKKPRSNLFPILFSILKLPAW